MALARPELTRVNLFRERVKHARVGPEERQVKHVLRVVERREPGVEFQARVQAGWGAEIGDAARSLGAQSRSGTFLFAARFLWRARMHTGLRTETPAPVRIKMRFLVRSKSTTSCGELYSASFSRFRRLRAGGQILADVYHRPSARTHTRAQAILSIRSWSIRDVSGRCHRSTGDGKLQLFFCEGAP